MAIFYLDSGSFGNVTVTNITATTSSILYVTSSELNVSTNRITVNTGTPEVRFGGLAVIDSGSSPQRSGSILFDSTNNQWIFVHQNTGGAITSSVFIQGPQTFNNVGSETTLTANRVPKATGGDLGEHIGDSNITDDGTTIQLGSAAQVTGSLIVSSSMTIASSSIGPNENTLTLGARDAVNEGGQIGFNAPGGTYTSASMIDLYQNRLRILRGTNTGSDAEVASWNMHSKQMALPAYNSATAFTGTTVASLDVDSGGNIITTRRNTPNLSLVSSLGSVIKSEQVLNMQSFSGASIALAAGRLYVVPVYLPQTSTLTGVKWFQVATGSYTPGNYTGVALYTITNGTLTLLVSSSNTNTFSSSNTPTNNTFASTSFSSTYTATAGTYYVGYVWNRTAQTVQPSIGQFPTIGGMNQSYTWDYTNSARTVCYFDNTTGSSAPTSLAMSNATNILSTLHFMSLY